MDRLARLRLRLKSLEKRRNKIQEYISKLGERQKKKENKALEARLITVPYETFVRLAEENSDAWEETDYGPDDNCFAAIRECVILDDGCWYRRNPDRCEELRGMYTLKDCEDVVLCDKCYPDEIAEALEERVGGGDQEIDPLNYPKELFEK